jgi:hypothetical protein
MTRADLDFMKKKVAAGEQPWKDAFERVKASVSLNDEIKVEQHIVRDHSTLHVSAPTIFPVMRAQLAGCVGLVHLG